MTFRVVQKVSLVVREIELSTSPTSSFKKWLCGRLISPILNLSYEQVTRRNARAAPMPFSALKPRPGSLISHFKLRRGENTIVETYTEDLDRVDGISSIRY